MFGLEERQKNKNSLISFMRKFFDVPARYVYSGGGLGFHITKGRLNISNNEVFEKDPTKIILFFYVMEKNNLLSQFYAIRAIRKSSKNIDNRLKNHIKTNDLFTNILCRPNAEKTLRAMNESGVLGKFIPDFGKIVGLMQFNMYHHYTADEHLIKAVGELKKSFIIKMMILKF